MVSNNKMSNSNTGPELKRDLEQRIKIIENLDDAELGSFKAFDWWILILLALVIPAIVVELAR